MDRWSEENIQKQRLENLALAREAKKKKQETSSKPPFTVTPIVVEKDIKSDTHEVIDTTKPGNSSFLYQLGSSLFYGLCTITVAVATPILVDTIRNTILHFRNPTDPRFDQHSEKTDSNRHNDGNFIFRKV